MCNKKNPDILKENERQRGKWEPTVLGQVANPSGGSVIAPED